MVTPSVQRANAALILAAIKSTRLVANANRRHLCLPSVTLPHHQDPHKLFYITLYQYHPSYAHHVEPTCRMAENCVGKLRSCSVAPRSRRFANKKKLSLLSFSFARSSEILTVHPEHRLTLSDIFQHPWCMRYMIHLLFSSSTLK